jgi:cysteinyl-tRNA synthetase
MFLSFHETLHDSVRRFHPPARRPVHLYVCGPTVYDRAHVGHARTYLYFDVVRRFLEAQGRTVRHVMNITDFEDKISIRAAALGMTSRALARREEARFFRDMDRLGIRPPTDTPRASEYVPEMVRVIRRLERAGFAERSDDALLYSPRRNLCTRNFPLAHSLEKLIVPEPGAPSPPTDGTASGFVLWRPPTPPCPSWPSPWGRGSPGWHLECYAMANHLLGLPVDLHGGGADLTFPHHYTENELACSLDQVLFSRSFLHLPFVTQNGEKMSKSTGNLVPLAEALDYADADALRWYLLGTPSTDRLEWSTQEFDAAIQRSRDAHAALGAAVPDGAGGSLSVAGLRTLRRGVAHDIADRLGVDRALGRLETYAAGISRRANSRYPRGSRREVTAELGAIDRLLGMRFSERPNGATGGRARRAG